VAEEEDRRPSSAENVVPASSLQSQGGKKRKSVVWMFFRRLSEDKIECSLCQLEMTLNKGKSTSHALRHLRAHHPKDLEDGEDLAAREEEANEDEYEELDAEEEFYDPDLTELPEEKVVTEVVQQTTADQGVVFYYHAKTGEVVTSGDVPDGGRPKSSVVWEFFHKVSDEAIECIFCQHTLSTYKGKSTSNMLRHMKSHHPKILAERQAAVSGGIKREDQTSEDVVVKRRGRPPTSADRDPHSIVWKYFIDLNPGQIQSRLSGEIIPRDGSGPDATALAYMRLNHANALLDASPEEESQWVRVDRSQGHEKRVIASEVVVCHFFVAVDETRMQCALCDKLVDADVNRMRNHLR